MSDFIRLYDVYRRGVGLSAWHAARAAAWKAYQLWRYR